MLVVVVVIDSLPVARMTKVIARSFPVPLTIGKSFSTIPPVCHHCFCLFDSEGCRCTPRGINTRRAWFCGAKKSKLNSKKYSTGEEGSGFWKTIETTGQRAKIGSSPLFKYTSLPGSSSRFDSRLAVNDPCNCDYFK